MRLLKHKAYINGEWIDSNSGKTFEVKNPFNNEVIGTVSDCGQEETKLAIEAASEAFKTWKKYSATERANLLKKWYQLQILMVHLFGLPIVLHHLMLLVVVILHIKV